ncbi:MAG: UDP-N-acetylmuramoyl-tripeptide--D-alanyl-D-alanine ligase [Deltaproteobacteria bacterium]|jgi:UDP-N-acetylmuramoyl-tripeptide--D-alanyl-D-alanine ligase|nr:UDP-N-acetylmuramoyl-tripeptide--D-alanyl-D-alanine ligase [Deltaproteobacteria bacterium]
MTREGGFRGSFPPEKRKTALKLGDYLGFLETPAAFPSASLLETEILKVATDSRTIKGGELFVALKGRNFDGNRFAGDALAKGARAALAEEGSRELFQGADVGEFRGRVAFVPDGLKALGDLARGIKRLYRLETAAVTGSVGKTTVKELLKNILVSQHGRERVLATAGNFNNLVGLPLTLLGASAENTVAVLEMGANSFGEIARLTEIAEPEVGLVTRAMKAHLQGFGDLEGVARAKGELFRNLKREAQAVVNFSDPLVKREGMKFPGNIMSFGRREDGAGYHIQRAEERDFGGRFPGGCVLVIKGPAFPEGIEVEFRLPGRHNRENALAAAAAAAAMGVDGEHVKKGLEESLPIEGRGRIHRAKELEAYILDDSYNANPGSMTAALELLGTLSRGRRGAVIGTMLELGGNAANEHYNLGLNLAKSGLSYLGLVGEHSEDVKRGALQGGMDPDVVSVLKDAGEAVDFIRGRAGRGDLILLKGSHSTGISRAARAFFEVPNAF